LEFVERLDFYNVKELIHIVNRSASIMNIAIDKNASEEIARRSSGTPRIVNRLLKRVRDFAEIKNCKITSNIAKEVLNALDIVTLLD
jgi:Holliday junction DNA helicase RuvB